MLLRPSVLVVDDQPDIREFVSLALEGEGYLVRCAEHGAAAIESLHVSAPDVILLDMRMPVMSGWEFLRTYRAQPGIKAAIIVMTAAQDARETSDGVQVDRYLAKPFEIDDLLDAVQALASHPNQHDTHD